MSDVDIVIAGAAIVDVPVVPAHPDVFSRTSTPAERIILTTGGDAMNESIVLSRLGKRVRLITRIGRDAAGAYIRQTCTEAGIDTGCFQEIDGLDTGVNVVLVDDAGERRFFTNPHGSLRALRAEDITPQSLHPAKIFCLASIFVFPLIRPAHLEQLFRMVREEGLITCADMTSPKNGETIRDLAPAMRYLDYFFTNLTEAEQLTGCSDPYDMADRLIASGAGHVIIKMGADGCLLARGSMRTQVPACAAQCIDTTGAGDTFAAGFFAALLDGCDFETCARRANACASLCVESVGASTGVHSARQAEQRFRSAYPEP